MLRGNCLSTKTRKCLSNQVGEEAAQEIFNVINGLCEEVETLRKEKLDKRIMFDVPNEPTRNNEY